MEFLILIIFIVVICSLAGNRDEQLKPAEIEYHQPFPRVYDEVLDVLKRYSALQANKKDIQERKPSPQHHEIIFYLKFHRKREWRVHGKEPFEWHEKRETIEYAVSLNVLFWQTENGTLVKYIWKSESEKGSVGPCIQVINQLQSEIISRLGQGYKPAARQQANQQVAQQKQKDAPNIEPDTAPKPKEQIRKQNQTWWTKP